MSRFSAVRAGAYQVTVLHGNTNIAGSPFAAIVAPADIDPAASYAIGEGMQTARCGQKARSRPMLWTAYVKDMPKGCPISILNPSDPSDWT